MLSRLKVNSPASFLKEGRGALLGTALATLLILGLIWNLTIASIVSDRRQAVEDHIRESQALSSMVAAAMNEALGRAVAYASLSTPLLKDGKAAPAALSRMADDDAAYLRFTIFNTRGERIYASERRQTEPELAALALEAMNTGKARMQSPGPLLGKPAETSPGEYRLLPVAVPLYSSPKKLAGALAAYIDLGRMLTLYQEASNRTRSRIEVLHSSGHQLVELYDGVLMRRPEMSPLLAELTEDALHKARTEAIPVHSDNNGIGAYRQLAEFPVGIAVMRDSAAVLTSLAARHHAYYLLAAVTSLALLAMMAGLIRLAQRQRRLYRELSQSESNKRELVGQLESEKARAFELASYDFLTGLPNRMMFHQLAAAELARARRSRKLYALFFLDLDKFKTINDTLGHAAGDLLLKAVAGRLRAALREYDLVARLGGDEFVVLVSELESTERVAKIAAKLVEALSAPYTEIADYAVETSPSIGIALYPGDGQDINKLLSHADAAMYNAKRSGRGTYRFYDGSLNTSSARRLELISRFRRAIRDGEFRLHYQMRIGIENFQPVGLEALVRWQHPTHGLIYPGEFIDLAEEHDFIVPLGHWAIDTACAQLAEWRASGTPLFPVAINISAKQLRDEKLIYVVSDALARYTIPPELIEIEVTESCFLERPDTAKRVLEKLNDFGIKISLDDYGTGFSGLSHLKQLPISVVKIDRSFIRDIRNDASDAMIVASTISLSHSLGLKVVAEGVETKEQLLHLKAAGCDEVQGFYFHRPQDAADIISGLRNLSVQPA